MAGSVHGVRAGDPAVVDRRCRPGAGRCPRSSRCPASRSRRRTRRRCTTSSRRRSAAPRRRSSARPRWRAAALPDAGVVPDQALDGALGEDAGELAVGGLAERGEARRAWPPRRPRSRRSRGAGATPSAYHCCIRPGPGRPATSGRLPPAMAGGQGAGQVALTGVVHRRRRVHSSHGAIIASKLSCSAPVHVRVRRVTSPPSSSHVNRSAPADARRTALGRMPAGCAGRGRPPGAALPPPPPQAATTQGDRRQQSGGPSPPECPLLHVRSPFPIVGPVVRAVAWAIGAASLRGDGRSASAAGPSRRAR